MKGITGNARPLPESDQPADTIPPPDPFLPQVRRWVWVPFGLAVINGFFLYGLAGLAETLYAWPIKPPVNAALMGAGYLAGMAGAGAGLFLARYWRSVRILLWPFFGLGTALLLTTLLHADRFRWQYLPTWLWTLVYFIVPPGAVYLWRKQERVMSARPPADSRLRLVRGLSGLLGLGLAGFSLLLFAVPALFLDSWPWPATPLLARTFASFYFFNAATLLGVAFTARRPHEVIIPALTWTTFHLLALPLPLLYSPDLRPPAAGLWWWLGLHLTLGLFCGGLLWHGLALAHSPGSGQKVEL